MTVGGPPGRPAGGPAGGPSGERAGQRAGLLAGERAGQRAERAFGAIDRRLTGQEDCPTQVTYLAFRAVSRKWAMDSVRARRRSVRAMARAWVRANLRPCTRKI